MQPGRELGLVTACILALAASVTSVTSWLESCGPIATTNSGTVAGSPNSGVQRTVCQPTADPVVVPGGTSLLLQNLVVPASTVLTAANNTASNGTVAVQLLSLPGVVQLSTGSSQLLLTNVTVQCSCSWLSQLAVALCNELPRLQLASWQVVPDSISVSTWSRSQLSLSNVQFTCPSAQGAQWRDVVTLSSSLQAQAARVLVVLDSNVDIPGNASLASIPIYRDVVVMGNPAVQAMLGQMVHVSMDAIKGMNAWTLDTSRGKLTFYNLVFNNLPMVSAALCSSLATWPECMGHGAVSTSLQQAMGQSKQHLSNLHCPLSPLLLSIASHHVHAKPPWVRRWSSAVLSRGDALLAALQGPFEKLPWATFGWGMWVAKTERCSLTSQLVVVDNCTLVLPTSTMTYMAYWTSELVAFVPVRRVAAQWYAMDATCQTAVPRTPLLYQAKLNSQVNWFVSNATGFGVQYTNTSVMDSNPDGMAPASPAASPPLAVSRIPAITWVTNASQLVQAMVNSSVRNIAVLANLSVSHTDWATYVKTTAGNASSNSSDGVRSPNNSNLLLTMTRPVALSGWPDVLTVVDWQGEPGQVQLSADAPLTLRWVTTMNGAPAEGWELGQVINRTTVFSLPPYIGPLLYIRHGSAALAGCLCSSAAADWRNQHYAQLPVLVDRYVQAFNITVWSLDGPAQSLGLPFYAIPQPEVVRLAALPASSRNPAAVVVPAVLVPLAAVAAMVGAVVWWRRRRRALAVAWAANNRRYLHHQAGEK
ncbi:hypothetical protein HaLaN_01679, partial [Haematococcus lacustris]